HVVDLVADALNDRGRAVRGSKVLLLGVAYKPNVCDFRESPALEIAEMLHRKGARVSYCDPHDPTMAAGELLLGAQELTPELLRESDCVVVVT
ncbi:UDP binding domain-containing protein, partial [Streptococcus pyogenes]